ncbi:hypothetical protein Micbo1qcDRAFT_158868 [Microdochium bolleyi]|uniref:CFEM domain-containing protein n=1 Tax=Microdochium bolleyi TaxID=196109 RepID=A0A136J9Y3_9PEZI|nr:hypothetical protein Micbo1qcDRAFT_158868 [Microdochium bolleyi]
MKASAVLAVAASLGSVSATFFHNAPPFTCPGNSNNHCLDEYKSGLNWQDLTPGKFDKYKGFRWKGFQAVNKFSKRSELGPRTFQDKSITGKAYKSRDQSPQMSCDVSAGNKKTTIKEIQIETAFDCDLEFHYGMPNGQICKQRHHCPKSGTTVPNNQCGGATDVTIVYPHQPQLPHDGCDFAIPSIGFDCDDNTPPPTSKPPVVKPPTSTSTYPVVPPPATVTTASSSTVATTSSPAVDTYTTKSVPGTTSSTFAPPQDTYSVTVPTGSASSSTATTLSTVSSPGVTTASTAPTASVATTSSVPGSQDTYSVIIPPGTNSGSSTVPTGTASVPVGTDSSSTVPGASTTSTAGVPTTSSTTLVVTTESSTPPQGSTTYPVVDTTVSSTPPQGTTTYPVVDTTPSAPPTTPVTPPSSTGSLPAPPPLETAPCPPVVPSCLNTWLFIVKCIDNTDSSCYCPDSKFVTSVFDCMYAHGETDDIIKEAVEYFQGICAPYVPQNPAIGTGAQTITQILTVTATAPPTAVYTTIQVVATSVVPCTDAQGVTIPSSSTTITYSTTVSVPEVHFSTITNVGSTQVAVVPGPTVAYPTAPGAGVPPPTATATAPGGGSGGGSYIPSPIVSTTLSTFKPPTATGGIIPSAPATTTIPIAGAARAGGLGVAGLVAVIALVL